MIQKSSYNNILANLLALSLLLPTKTLASGVLHMDYFQNPRSLFTRDSNTVSTNIIGNTDFTVTFSIGTPEQSLVGGLSNLFGDILVNDISNNICGSSDSKISLACDTYGSFDPSKSSTFQETSYEFKVNSSTSTPSNGYYALDSLTFGGQTLEDVPFGVLTDSQTTRPVFGLGYPTTEGLYETSSDSYTNFPGLLADRGITKSATYSVAPSRVVNSQTTGGQEGSILFGGIDHAKYTGDLIELSVLQTNGRYVYPNVQVDSVIGSDQSKVLGSNIVATLALGQLVSYVPKSIADDIKQATNFNVNSGGSPLVSRCRTTGKNITLVFSGDRKLVVPLDSFITRVSSNSPSCTLQILESDSESEMILGYGFFANTFMFTDLTNHVIKLAPASFSTGSDIEIIEDGGENNNDDNNVELLPGSSSGSNSSSSSSDIETTLRSSFSTEEPTTTTTATATSGEESNISTTHQSTSIYTSSTSIESSEGAAGTDTEVDTSSAVTSSNAITVSETGTESIISLATTTTTRSSTVTGTSTGEATTTATGVSTSASTSTAVQAGGAVSISKTFNFGSISLLIFLSTLIFMF